MTFEHSAGAIIFFRRRHSFSVQAGLDFLLVRYAKRGGFRWDYVKGGVEKGETSLAAMLREVREETGIKYPRYIRGFHRAIKWHYQRAGKPYFKTVDFYLVESPTRKVSLSPEHSAYAWMPYQVTLRRLKHKNAREILQKAYEFLTKQK
ncbi:NUDIX domain-containing protein [Candidatus Parcubacteria bacterium]|nr:MAG: NUDIX domain-containing protein [Candidatus Parcubacteria bacterium]